MSLVLIHPLLAFVGLVPGDVVADPLPLVPAFHAESTTTPDVHAPEAGSRDPIDATRVVDAVVDALHFDIDSAGTTWVRGRTYKASFSPDEVEYVPFLGSRAPRNYPVALRVESVSVGGVDLAFDHDVAPVRRGDAIEYERGPFRERYLLATDGVEQTFEFDTLPSRGDVVVEVSVDTDLATAEDADGFRFGNELGHVRYGRAFALHGALEATPIATRIADGRITITAPASLVESAVGRLVIDPVLNTFAIADDAPDQFGADTAYDETHGEWFTVIEEVFSGTDHDVRIVQHFGIMGFLAWTYVDLSAEDWRAPAIANNNKDDQFLVVAARGAAPNRAIWGRTVGATQSMLPSAKFLVSDGGDSGDHHSPDVGGDMAVSGSTYYCVVWQRDVSASNSDIHGRMIETNATGLGASTLLLDTSAGRQTNPAISNSNGTSATVDQRWNVVWEHEAAPGNHDIRGRQVHWDGTSPGAWFAVASSVLDERNPSASSRTEDLTAIRPWMVAYQVQTGANGWDVRCRSLNDTTVVATFDLSAQFPTHGLDQIEPTCDTIDTQFVVAYDERPSGVATTSEVRVATLYSIAGGLGLNEGDVSASPGLNLDSRPRIVAMEAAGSDYWYALVVFDRDAGGPNDVMASRYEMPRGGPAETFCSGDGTGAACPCANFGATGRGCASSTNASGALLQPWYDARLSHDTFHLYASGMASSTTVLFFQGTAQAGGGAGTVFGDGLRCASGTVVRLGTKAASFGAAHYPDVGDAPIGVQGSVPAAGAVRYYQAWYRNSAAYCTASTFNLTNGVRVQWIP